MTQRSTITSEKRSRYQASVSCLLYSRFGDYGWLSTVYVLRVNVPKIVLNVIAIGYSNEFKNHLRFSFIRYTVFSIQHHGKYITNTHTEQLLLDFNLKHSWLQNLSTGSRQWAAWRTFTHSFQRTTSCVWSISAYKLHCQSSSFCLYFLHFGLRIELPRISDGMSTRKSVAASRYKVNFGYAKHPQLILLYRNVYSPAMAIVDAEDWHFLWVYILFFALAVPSIQYNCWNTHQPRHDTRQRPHHIHHFAAAVVFIV